MRYYLNFSSQVYTRKCTHVTSMGCMLHGNHIIDKILSDISRVADKKTKILIWDIYSNVPWDEICANRHLRFVHPLISPEEMTEAITRSPLKQVTCLDFTKNILRSVALISEEALKRDPEQIDLTYPLMRDAFHPS